MNQDQPKTDGAAPVSSTPLFDDLPPGTRFKWAVPKWWRNTLMDGEYVKSSATNFGPPDSPNIWEAGSDAWEPVIPSNAKGQRPEPATPDV